MILNCFLIKTKLLFISAKDAVGRNLWGPHRLKSLQGIKVTAAFAGSCAVHTVILVEGGQAFTWGMYVYLNFHLITCGILNLIFFIS